MRLPISIMIFKMKLMMNFEIFIYCLELSTMLVNPIYFSHVQMFIIFTIDYIINFKKFEILYICLNKFVRHVVYMNIFHIIDEILPMLNPD